MSAVMLTLYPDEKTEYRVHDPRVRQNDRSIVRVEVDDMAIQASCWEHLQPLVDALSDVIARAQAAEAAEALSGDVEVSA